MNKMFNPAELAREALDNPGARDAREYDDGDPATVAARAGRVRHTDTRTGRTEPVRSGLDLRHPARDDRVEYDDGDPATVGG